MTGDNEWTVLTLKEHFEKLLDERYATIKVTFQKTQATIEKVDSRLDVVLQEFPQDYGRKEDFESLRKEITTIKADHVQRREFDSLKEDQAQGRGVRIALIAASGIMIALITVALGSMYANQLDHRDVSQQISTEAPWLSDRPVIEEEIHQLQQQVILLKTQLLAHETTDKIRASLKKGN